AVVVEQCDAAAERLQDREVIGLLAVAVLKIHPGSGRDVGEHASAVVRIRLRAGFIRRKTPRRFGLPATQRNKATGDQNQPEELATFHQKISGAFTGSLPQFGGAGRPFAATRDLTGSGRGPPVPGVPGGPGGRFARCEETRTPRLASFPAADTGPPARTTDRRRWGFWRSPPVPSATRRRLP